MFVTMDDPDYNENVLRDLYSVSNYGDIQEILDDYRRSQKPAKDSNAYEEPRRPPTPKRSRWRTRGKFSVGPDFDEPPRSMGRGVWHEAFGGSSQPPSDINRGLQEIESGCNRNESIEKFFEEIQVQRQYENLDEDECAAEVVPHASPSCNISQSSSSSLPAEESAPKTKAKKSKKQRNVVLRSFLSRNAAEVAEAEPVLQAKSASKATMKSAVDEDASSDTYILAGNIGFMTIADSYTSSDLEVIGQESYSIDDSQASVADDSQSSLVDSCQTFDELQVSVDGLTDISSSSMVSKSSSCSEKSPSGKALSSSSKRSSSSSKSSKGYHKTSRRKQMVAVSPLTLQNPSLGRRSPLGDVYVPYIVETKFTYKDRDFPPL